MDRGADTYIGVSPISYATEGEAGSQIFKLQYKNAGFLGEEPDTSGLLPSSINFQIWFYEGSNDIEIHFGPSNFAAPFEEIDDFTGPLIALADSITEQVEYIIAVSLFECKSRQDDVRVCHLEFRREAQIELARIPYSHDSIH